MEEPKIAIALQYEEDSDAPKVIAKGKGIVAEKIIETAKEGKIYTEENEDLALSLYDIDLGDSIPEELYSAVAKILLYIHDLDKLKGK
ncbi:EscU/YscU/HrcU family type III secretion system export apparatus switch protein [Clostridiaceae bacterium M8S5]|nr:EscU/YscU/HrcU family type III secretion system export apparatus switch protein [Clostridiaceae bacterium M8S5]